MNFDYLSLRRTAHQGHSGGIGGLGDGRDVAARAQQCPVDAIDPSAGVLCDAQFAGSLEQAVVSRLRRVGQDIGLVDASDEPSGGLHDEHVRGVLHAHRAIYAHLAVQQGIGHRLANGLAGKVGHFDLAAIRKGERGGVPACPHQFFQPVECGGWCTAKPLDGRSLPAWAGTVLVDDPGLVVASGTEQHLAGPKQLVLAVYGAEAPKEFDVGSLGKLAALAAEQA